MQGISRLVSSWLASVPLISPSSKRRRLNDHLLADDDEASRLDALPVEVVRQIATYLGTPADLASTARSCRAMLAPLRDLLRALDPVLDLGYNDPDLPRHVREFVGHCQNNPSLRALVTPQMAVGLYDVVVKQCRRHPDDVDDLIRTLAMELHPVVYGALLHDCRYNRWRNPIRHILCPDQVVDLARHIVDEDILQYAESDGYDADTVASLKEARQNVAPSFDNVFPLGRNRPVTYGDMFASAESVCALLLRGIRFTVERFLEKMPIGPATDLCRIYPLLIGCNLESDLQVLTDCARQTDTETFRQFLRVPNVSSRLRQAGERSWITEPVRSLHCGWGVRTTLCLKRDCAFWELCERIVRGGEIAFLHIIIGRGLIAAFAPCLLSLSFEYSRTAWIDLLLRTPEVAAGADCHYVDALCSFVKYQKPNAQQFDAMLRRKPFSADLDVEDRMEVLAAVAYIGDYAWFTDLLQDRFVLRKLFKTEAAIAKIFCEAVRGQQDGFIHAILHEPGIFYGIISVRDELLSHALVEAIANHSSRAAGFLRSAMALPHFRKVFRSRTKGGRTPLHAAFQIANLDLVDLLLSDDRLDGFFTGRHRNCDVWPSLVAKLPLDEDRDRSRLMTDMVPALYWHQQLRYRAECGDLLHSILTSQSFMKSIVNVRREIRRGPTLLHCALEAHNYAAVCDLLTIPELDLRQRGDGPECLSLLTNLQFEQVPEQFRTQIRDLKSTLAEHHRLPIVPM